MRARPATSSGRTSWRPPRRTPPASPISTPAPGETEGGTLWSKLAAAQTDPAKVYAAVDGLARQRPAPRARSTSITESTQIRKDPTDWEALYRDGVALQSLGRADDARRRFQDLLDLRGDDDRPSAAARARTRDPKLRATGARPSAYAQARVDPLMSRTSAAMQIRLAAKIETRNVYNRAASIRTSWALDDFGQARMAAAPRWIPTASPS